MTDPVLPPPPEQYKDFIARFPELEKAWGAIATAGRQGPLDARTVRLVKFALAVGAQQEGSVNSSVRKARAQGLRLDELEQVIALAAGTLGMPRVVAAWSWLKEIWK